MSKNDCFRGSQSGDIGKRQKLRRRRKVIKEQERWGTGTRNRPIIIHDRDATISKRMKRKSSGSPGAQ